jgi:phosphoserine phosphatase
MLMTWLFIFGTVWCQSYTNIAGWSPTTNQQLESFLNSTAIIKERKVAVFDCDGTLFGQVPHYLADEALYAFAKSNYEGKNDSLSKAKMTIVKRLLQGNNVGTDYVRSRIDFLAGLSPEEVGAMGKGCFQEKFQGKFYPEMRELLHNLEKYGFEIWVLTASPELLYQTFVHENLGIPENRILGVKSVVSNGKVSDQLVAPIPQDAGKAAAIETFIKARPLLVAGNSRGDLEMMERSVGIKLIVNPDGDKVQKGEHAGKMRGLTVKEYWDRHNGLSVYCHDVAGEDTEEYVAGQWGIGPNTAHPKR